MQHITNEVTGARAGTRAPLMTVGDLAEQRNCSVATVWRHVKAGLLPKPVKIGGLTRWVPEEVDAATEAAMAARSPQIAA